MHGIDGFKSLFSLSICENFLNYDLLYQNNSIIVHVDYHLFDKEERNDIHHQ